ncbi:MAG: RNA-binding S4 domain-containing protein [Bacteroidia bacterium]|nr:RNA-binding S4 domain-containing protein [Bacteroidia bacterium]
MESYKLKEDYIPLNQLLKILGWCGSAPEANLAIDEGSVKVNGTIEYRKRNKITAGTKVEFKGNKVSID